MQEVREKDLSHTRDPEGWISHQNFGGQEAVDFKEKTNLLTKNSISGKAVLNSEGEIKTFPDKEKLKEFINTQFTSVTQSCPNLCDPMECTMPGPLFLTNSRSLLKLMSTYGVGDAIQPSHPLSSPSPPAFNLSQHQDLCQ